MRHEIIDPTQFELTDKVVSIKRVSKTCLLYTSRCV